MFLPIRPAKFLCVIVAFFLLAPAGPEAALTYSYDSRHRLVEARYPDRLVITYAYDAAGNRTTKTSTALNLPPLVPANPVPVDGSEGVVGYTVTFGWTGGDPDPGDELYYDLYLGRQDNPPLVASGLSAASAVRKNLESESKYFWRIVTHDQSGQTTAGPIWRFTTADVYAIDTDGDTISDGDEVVVYGTDRLAADTDGDGIDDGEELAYWGQDWNADPDGDGVYNLIDRDSDNDGFADGVEIASGTDPADPNSRPILLQPLYFLLLENN